MVMEQLENTLGTSFGSFELHRFPVRKKETLRAWDAADEYVLQYLEENELLHDDLSLLIVNDSFGALSVPLSHLTPVVMTDSYLSMQAISSNLKANGLDYDSVTIINSLHSPDSVLEGGSKNGIAEGSKQSLLYCSLIIFLVIKGKMRDQLTEKT